MYHDYATHSYYTKTHAQELVKEAQQARQAREYRLANAPQTVSKQKKVYFSSFGSIASVNTLVRHDI